MAEARRPARPDRRLLTGVLLALTVGAFGQLLSWWVDDGGGVPYLPPQAGTSPPAVAAQPPAPAAPRPLPAPVDPANDAAGHVRSARAREVATRFDQAVSMLHAGQHQYAFTALHRVLELAPELPEAHVNMGFALLGLERPREALDFFATAIDLRPGQHNGYYGLALALEKLGRTREAIEAMETFTHLERDDTAYRRRGIEIASAWRRQVGEIWLPDKNAGATDGQTAAPAARPPTESADR